MRSFLSKNVRAGALTIIGMLFILSSDAFAQGVKSEYLWKLRGRDRFEGIRTKNWKPVSGEIKLASLVYQDKDWLASAANSKPEQVTIHFYSNLTSGIELEVFNLDMQYFMNPRIKSFSKNWNEFAWPGEIINAVNLSVTKLNAVANGQKGKFYFPISFQKPTKITPGSSLKAMLIPDKDMTVDIALYSPNSPNALKTWDAQKMLSDQPYTFELPVSALKMGEAYLLKATEKGGREFSYNFQFFGK